MTLKKIVKEEIVNTMMNEYDYKEIKADEFAELYANRIEANMWIEFDKTIEEIMERKEQ